MQCDGQALPHNFYAIYNYNDIISPNDNTHIQTKKKKNANKPETAQQICDINFWHRNRKRIKTQTHEQKKTADKTEKKKRKKINAMAIFVDGWPFLGYNI